MRRNPVGITVGLLLVAFALYTLIIHGGIGGLTPLLIGASLVYLGVKPGRTALIVFGHACVVAGCVLFTWGIYLLPYSQPVWQHIIFRPLFWGMISIFGGICANYHGFCRCVRAGASGPAPRDGQ
jgi:hypothetical protein